MCENRCAITGGTWCASTSASWGFGSAGKRASSPLCRENNFFSMELDSVSVVASLTNEHAQSVLNCLSSFRGRVVIPLKHFQRLLGHMVSAAAVPLLRLLHMGPLQHRLHSRVLKWAWRCNIVRVTITLTLCH